MEIVGLLPFVPIAGDATDLDGQDPPRAGGG